MRRKRLVKQILKKYTEQETMKILFIVKDNKNPFHIYTTDDLEEDLEELMKKEGITEEVFIEKEGKNNKYLYYRIKPADAILIIYKESDYRNVLNMLHKI